jgi:hypothetical protein
MVTDPVVTTSEVGPGGDHVGGGAAGDRAVEARRDDRDLRRPARAAAAQGGGQVEEELAAAGPGQEGPEHHEEKDVGAGHPERHAEDAIGGEHHDVQEVLGGDHPVVQRTRETVAEEVVDHEERDDQGEPQAHGPPGGLQGQDQQDRGEDRVEGRERVEQGHAVGDRLRIDHEVEAGDRAYPRKQEVVNRRAPPVRPRRGAHGQKHQHQHQGEENDGQGQDVDQRIGGGIDHPEGGAGGIDRHHSSEPTLRPSPGAGGKGDLDELHGLTRSAAAMPPGRVSPPPRTLRRLL